MKVFLSVSFSANVDAAGRVLPAYRKELEAVISVFETLGHAVYCAPREDQWARQDTSAAEAFKVDFQHVDKCDLFIAFIGNHISAGVQMEIGFALAKGKRIILASPEGAKLGYVNQGLVDTSGAELIKYGHQQDLLIALAAIETPEGD